MYSSYLVGNKGYELYINKISTGYDVGVTFYATTKQYVNVGLYGGESRATLVGPETTIRYTAADAQCPYTVVVPFKQSTSAAKKALPAMNYTVTFEDLDIPAPKFKDGLCDQTFDATTGCACGESLTPREYFTIAKKLSQDVTIYRATSLTEDMNLEYVYKTAVCFELIGGDALSEYEGVSPKSGGTTLSCLPKKATVLEKDGKVRLTINAFERYPESTYPWFSSERLPSGKYKYNTIDITANTRRAVDLYVPNTVLFIRDLVSGKPNTQRVEYDSTLVPLPPPKEGKRPKDYGYTIVAGSPRTDFPFNWPFQVTVQRSGPEGYSIANKYWYIIIVGSSPNEVPNVYPVSSDPTLIFLVLRDPPGGGSTASISQGTSMSLSMGIDDM